VKHWIACGAMTFEWCVLIRFDLRSCVHDEPPGGQGLARHSASMAL
jgi:hypothetical protein